MTALALIVRPTHRGWAVYLTDGRELARFRGPGSKWRALRYLATATNAPQTPDVARKTPSAPGVLLACQRRRRRHQALARLPARRGRRTSSHNP
jgi:hypothetical protein